MGGHNLIGRVRCGADNDVYKINMREIRFIVLHCTATPKNTKISSIQRYWRETMGWKSPGYHYIIKDDGEAVQLLDESLVSNGVAGFNQHSIHISYIGGINDNGQPVDNRSIAQKITTINMLYELKGKYPKAEIKGHRDFPGVKKACPSFDVKTWLSLIKFDQI